jgi:peroxiredoxin
MSDQEEHTPTSISADPGDASPERVTSKKTALLGLGVAAFILVAAWFIADRAGLSDVGTGGINAGLLPKVGEPAPDFVAISLTGDIVRLSDFQGQPVWINFWGAWCPPCRAEMPDIQAAYEELAPEGLTLLAVSLGDPPAEAAAFAAKVGATFTILLDPDRSLTGPSYPIYNFPTHVFIDEHGIVQKIVLSEMDTNQAIAAAGSIMDVAAIEERRGNA